MKRLAILALCLAFAALAYKLGQPAAPAADDSVKNPGPSAAATPRKTGPAGNATSPLSPSASPGAISAPAAAASPAEKEQRLQTITDASATYSPDGVPAIAPFLLDPDSEIRTAAKEGLINLAEAGGAAVLRQAAKQLKDPREATAYLDAAEFLELPPWSEVHPDSPGPTGIRPPSAGPEH